MSVTNIVMLMKDRPRLTEQALDSLLKHTPMSDFNLTIIDDGTTDPLSIRVMENAAAWPNVTLLCNEKSKGITGQVRNLGVYWAEKYWGRGDYLYLTDNDVYFTKNWLQVLTTMAEHLNPVGINLLGVLGGWNHPFLQPLQVYGLANEWRVKTHDAVAGASQLMRWSTWDQYGPLDAHAPGVGQSEDWAFCQKIIKDGGRVGSIYPRVVYNCGLTNSLGQASPGADLMLKELQEAKKTHPWLYWE